MWQILAAAFSSVPKDTKCVGRVDTKRHKDEVRKQFQQIVLRCTKYYCMTQVLWLGNCQSPRMFREIRCPEVSADCSFEAVSPVRPTAKGLSPQISRESKSPQTGLVAY